MIHPRTSAARGIEDEDPGRDWTEPGIFRCAPGVYRIPLPLPHDGLRAVNVYAISHDGDGPAAATLVDGGWALAGARDQLIDALSRLDMGVGDVDRFLVTHAHRDHYTQAAVLGTEFGVRVALGRGEEPSLREILRPDHVPTRTHRARLLRAGAGEVLRGLEQREAEMAETDELAAHLWRDPDEWLDDGARLSVGTRTLTAVATPGHTKGHLVFADEAADLLFAGDHVLPRITPSIGFEPLPPPSPLADFLTSLALVRSRPDALLLPAHGPVGMRVHERVDALVAHHDARLEATLVALRHGASTAAEVAAVLTWTRHERTLAELDDGNRVLAILETLSHLDVLVERGIATGVSRDGIEHYTTS